jgi:hypothetical protein
MKTEYTIIYWENEEMRDIGESSVYDSYELLEVAISKAKNLYYKQDFPSVEVEDEDGNTIFHISNEVPEGEEY